MLTRQPTEDEDKYLVQICNDILQYYKQEPEMAMALVGNIYVNVLAICINPDISDYDLKKLIKKHNAQTSEFLEMQFKRVKEKLKENE